MENGERLRKTIDALHAYCENRDNPLSGPRYVKLVEEMFAAQDALVEERKKAAE
jgi:hypothetical protein